MKSSYYTSPDRAGNRAFSAMSVVRPQQPAKTMFMALHGGGKKLQSWAAPPAVHLESNAMKRYIQPAVFLISNNQFDGQWSMLRFSNMLRANLTEAGIRVVQWHPRRVLTGRCSAPRGLGKWLDYADKFCLGKLAQAQALREFEQSLWPGERFVALGHMRTLRLTISAAGERPEQKGATKHRSARST